MSVEELNAASSLLEHALLRYTEACSALENCTVSRRLFDRSTDELATVTSYEMRMCQAKLALFRVKIRYSPLVTINSLPPEILYHIFQLVTSEEDCISEDKVNLEGQEFPKYPELLSHVCSRWRRMIITSVPLNIWTHIDLVPCHRFSRGLLARARHFVALSAPLALTIHIVDPINQYHDNFDLEEFLDFLAYVSPRMRSLQIIASDYRDLFWCIFQSCFEGSVPGTLQHVTILSSNRSECGRHSLIESNENPHSSLNMLFRIPHQQLEEVWRSTKTLNLDLYFPYWASKAYHSLVELRLTAASSISTPLELTGAQLINILLSSPELRILHFGIGLIYGHPNDSSIVPVRLGDLETLSMIPLDFDQAGVFLRMIAPGRKPLRMSVELFEYSDAESPTSISIDEAQKFFTRSNVTSFSMKGFEEHQWADIVLGILPSLEDLSLISFVYDEHLAPPTSEHQSQSPERNPCFNHLRISSGTIDLEGLRRIIQNHMVQTLAIRDSSISLNGRNISDEEAKGHLSDTGVMFKL